MASTVVACAAVNGQVNDIDPRSTLLCVKVAHRESGPLGETPDLHTLLPA